MLNFDFDQSIVVSLSSGRVGGHIDEEVEAVCVEAKEGMMTGFRTDLGIDLFGMMESSPCDGVKEEREVFG